MLRDLEHAARAHRDRGDADADEEWVHTEKAAAAAATASAPSARCKLLRCATRQANPLFQLLICRSDPKTGNTPTSVAGLGLGPALEPNCVAGVGLGAATEITTAEIEVEEAPRTRVDAALR